jgi:hypothetical protein
MFGRPFAPRGQENPMTMLAMPVFARAARTARPDGAGHRRVRGHA